MSIAAEKNIENQILIEGRNCQRLVSTKRMRALVDAAEYCSVLYSTLIRAKETIYIAGWDIDSQVELIKGKPTPAHLPSQLGPLINALVEQNKELRVYLLCWDYSLLFLLERDVFPALKFQWGSSERIQFKLDSHHPLVASHHQKIVVVDDSIAFVGGIDLCRCRWDTPDHQVYNPLRTSVNGKEYGPFHDVHTILEGEIVNEVAQEFRNRWYRFSGKYPISANQIYDHWPRNLKAEVTNAPYSSLSRTYPNYEGQKEVREVENLTIDLIDKAREFIYIENQYLTSERVAQALAQSLQKKDGPYIIMILAKLYSGIWEYSTLGRMQNILMNKIKSHDRWNRLRMLTPFVIHQKQRIYIKIHSKVIIVDNEILRIGSANLSNRSMGLDTECDYCIEARGDHHISSSIKSILSRLLSEHMGTNVGPIIKNKDIRDLVSLIDSLKISDHNKYKRGLEEFSELEPIAPKWAKNMIPTFEIGDPEGPIILEERDKTIGDPTMTSFFTRPIVLLITVLVTILAISIFWGQLERLNLINLTQIIEVLKRLENHPLTPAVVVVGYVVGALLVVPLNFMILVVSLSFSPGFTFTFSLLGVALSAVTTFFLGRLVGLKTIKLLTDTPIYRISQKISHNGFLTVLFLRLVPVAPYTFVNLLSGASHIKFRDFFVATMLAVLPGLLTLSFLGEQVRNIIISPNWSNIILFTLILTAFLLSSWTLRKRFSRAKRNIS